MDEMRNWDEIVAGNIGGIVAATGEWRRWKGFETGWENFGEKLMLVLTEVSEVLDASDNVVSFRRDLMQPVFEDISAYLSGYIGSVKNYVEEWTDVLVRIFDLCEACEISVEEPPRRVTGKSLGDPGRSRPLLEVFPGIASSRSSLVLRALSSAMEVFRDVELEKGSDGRLTTVDCEETDKAMEILGSWISSAVIVAMHAIEDVGAVWRKEYAKKMKVNEGRSSRHGRQR